ncbi:MAG: glycosyltransferase family 9 protein [Cyanobacteria bacterium P01_H01_bin.74]
MPMRILITRLSAHGDIIHTLPLIRALKAADPAVFIGWFVSASGVGLLENHPDIDRLHVSHQKTWLKAIKPLESNKSLKTYWHNINSAKQAFQQLLTEIKQEDYTHSIDVQGLLKSAFWPYLAKIRVRYGFKNTREGASFFYTHCVPPMVLTDSAHHVTTRYLDFVKALGFSGQLAVNYRLPNAFDKKNINETLPLPAVWRHQQRENKRAIVVIAPFTQWQSKRWPLTHWQELIALILTPTNTSNPSAGHSKNNPKQYPVGLVLIGGPENHDDAHQLCNALRDYSDQICNLVGKTKWPDLYAIMRNADIVVGADSAPLHIADACAQAAESETATSRIPKGSNTSDPSLSGPMAPNTPNTQNSRNKPIVIGIYGPTAPGRTGPISQNSQTVSTQLPCQPCFKKHCPIQTHNCMIDLTPRQVEAAVNAHLML